MKIFIASMLFFVTFSAKAALVPPVIENARRAVVASKFLRSDEPNRGEAENLAKIVMDYACVQVVQERFAKEHILSFDYDNGLRFRVGDQLWYTVAHSRIYRFSQVIINLITKPLVAAVIVGKSGDAIDICAYIVEDLRSSQTGCSLKGTLLGNREDVCKKVGDLSDLVMPKSARLRTGVQFDHGFLSCDLSHEGLARLAIFAGAYPKRLFPLRLPE